MAAVVLTGVASAIGGVGFAQQVPEGAVPMASDRDPAPNTHRGQRASKRW